MGFFGISRGFRRLNVLIGFIEFLSGAFIFLTDFRPDEPLRDYAMVFGWFVVAPVLVTLVAGWVVAGFRSN